MRLLIFVDLLWENMDRLGRLEGENVRIAPNRLWRPACGPGCHRRLADGADGHGPHAHVRRAA